MVINLKELLELYDTKTLENIGCVAAINAMIGEDLAVVLFFDYARRNNLNPTVISEKCNQGKNQGVRLDRWLSVEEGNQVIYYQTEIKNWTAHSYRGNPAPDNSDVGAMEKYRMERWGQRFDISNKCLRDTTANKVLVPMKLDSTDPPKVVIRPLIIFWEAMHPEGSSKEFFSVHVSGSHFKNLWIFSMSSYIRNLLNKEKPVTEIKVNMPAVDARIKWLNSVYK
jgi:hypothetical protein